MHHVCLVIGDNVEDAMAPFGEDFYSYKITSVQDVYRSIQAAPQYELTDMEVIKWMRQKLEYWGGLIYVVTLEDFNPEMYQRAALARAEAIIAFDTNGTAHEIHNRHNKGRWDWYEIGGRWPGKLMPKDGVIAMPPMGLEYTPGGLHSMGTFATVRVKPEALHMPGGVDRLKKGQIDFAAMSRVMKEQSTGYETKLTNAWIAYREKHIPIRRMFESRFPDGDFQDFLNGGKASGFFPNDKVYKQYKEQDSVKAINIDRVFCQPDHDEFYSYSRAELDEYMDLNRNTPTDEIIVNGEWIGLGWNDRHGEITRTPVLDHYRKLKAIIDNLSDDTFITVVDYHC